MNTIAWLMFGNAILAGILGYQIYEASKLIHVLDDMYSRNFSKITELLDTYSRLKEKIDDTIRK
jgi:hypothetical protein